MILFNCFTSKKVYFICNNSFSCPLVHETGLVLTPEVFSAGFEGLGTVNFNIPPRNFTVILLITFDFQHFLT